MFEWINSSIKNYVISIVEKEFFESDDDKLKIQKLSNNAIIPVKATKLAAGYDLYSIDSITIPPLSRVLVNIGLSIKTPDGTYGRIAPRSGMSLNKIDVGGGVIDQDYTGPLKVILINNNEDEFKVVEGMKVAQLICEKICLPEIQIVDKLEQTERGSNGFGSTGILISQPLRAPSTSFAGGPEGTTFQKTTQINKKFEFTYDLPKIKFTTNNEDKSETKRVEEKSEKLNEEVKKEN